MKLEIGTNLSSLLKGTVVMIVFCVLVTVLIVNFL